MANHKSALKRIRGNEAKRVRNRYQLKTARTIIKKLRTTTDKKVAVELFKTAQGVIDKLVKNGIIHKNNGANKKSGLAHTVAGLK
jgi:small subunit ribosomal protein S20